MATTYKGYTTQSTGSNAGTWGTVLNDEALDYIDQNLGGITSKSLTNVNVTLTADESRNAILRLTGTLTGAVQITTECIGFFFVENLTTGSFAVTVRNNLVATAATIGQGARTIVTSDGTNGCRVGAKPFETGTKMTFYNTTAPVGWTKDTSAALNNAAIRLVTGTGQATGGTTDFTSVFTGRTIARSDLPNVNLSGTTSGQSADHSHNIGFNQSNGGGENGSNIGSVFGGSKSTGGTSNDHTHTFSVALNGGVSQTQMNFSVKYADFIVATAD